MSEYQYYEFRAIDRPLTKAEMAELRNLSTRAEITATSFTNEYNYGNFRGDPMAMMRNYFDAFVYITNWGTHELMLRIPRGFLSLEIVREYGADEYLDIYEAGENIILDFQSQNEEGDWEEGEGWLDRLVGLRADILRGDLRALYLGWLQYADFTMDDWEDSPDYGVEPPVPPGLRTLTPALKDLTEFLRISPDLVAVAAERSLDMPDLPSHLAGVAPWIEALPEAEKTKLLLQLVNGNESMVKAELLQRFARETVPSAPLPGMVPGERTDIDLARAAQERKEDRKRTEAERKAKEQERKARERAAKRAAYLDDLAMRQDETWNRIELLIQTKRPQEYDQAAQYLIDLRDVAVRTSTQRVFRENLQELRARHAKKSTLMARLDQRGLHWDP